MELFKFIEDEEGQIISPYLRCPHCNELISLKVTDDYIHFAIRNCPHCKIFLNAEEVGEAYVKHKELVKAMNSVGEVKASQYAIPIIFAFLILEFAFIYGFNDEIPALKYMIFIVAVLWSYGNVLQSFNWLKEFGVKNFQDEEHERVKEEVKLAYKIWVCVLFIIFFTGLFQISLFL